MELLQCFWKKKCCSIQTCPRKGFFLTVAQNGCTMFKQQFFDVL